MHALDTWWGPVRGRAWVGARERVMGSRRWSRLPAGCLLLAGSLCMAPRAGALTCQASEGPPGGETTVRIDILDPPSPATIPPSAPCGQDVLISGTLSVTGPPTRFDVYVVV